jgi:hypothetical protein
MWDGSSNVIQRTRQAGPSERQNWRGTLVVPADVGWIIKRNATDLTSRSLRRQNWRGTLVVPADVGWIIKRNATDLTSRSLRSADPTSGSLRSADLTSRSLREAKLGQLCGTETQRCNSHSRITLRHAVHFRSNECKYTTQSNIASTNELASKGRRSSAFSPTPTNLTGNPIC